MANPKKVKLTVVSGSVSDGKNNYLPGDVFEIEQNHAQELIDAAVCVEGDKSEEIDSEEIDSEESGSVEE